MGTIKYLTSAHMLAACSGNSSHLMLTTNGALNANDILVGYGQISIVEKDKLGQPNGSVVKIFNTATTSSNYASNGSGIDIAAPYMWPNESVPPYITPWLPQNYSTYLDMSNKQLPPTPAMSLEGKLMSEQYYDNATHLKTIDYTYQLANYTNNFYSVKAIQNREGGFTYSSSCPGGANINTGVGSGGIRPVNLLVSPAKCFNAQMNSKVETTYSNGNTLTSTTNYTYDSYNQLKTSQFTSSDGTNKTNTYTYPYDNLQAYYFLMSAHMYSTVISSTEAHNGNTAQIVKSDYVQPSSGVYVPQNTQVQIGTNPIETRQVYNAYDIYGHLLEKQAPLGVKESYLWGYNFSFPVAYVIGASNNTIAGLVDASVLNNPASDIILRRELDKLRTLPNTLVTTYTYDPVFGKTSETDPRGKTKYYKYDAIGRLVLIIDQDNNILKKICYNYAGQPENCNIATYTNELQQATFTSTTCAAGLIAPSTTYSVAAGSYTAYDLATANQLAKDAMNTNGQAAANALPCLAPISGWNQTSQPWNITVTNASGTVNTTYSFYPGSSSAALTNLPVGTYTFVLAPMYSGSVTSPVQLTLNGINYSGTSFNIPYVNIGAASTITLQNPPASGPCSYTVSSGYSSPSSSISNNGTTASGYYVFYSTSTMSQGNSYMVATINGGCRPSATRSFSTSSSGRTWTVTIYPSGQMYVQMAYGSASVSPYSTVSISISYNL